VEVWEGMDPGGVRVLVANPRWERRFLKFLELSGEGRVMADGLDEDGARTVRMDEWVVWEAEERGGEVKLTTFFLCFYISFVRGTHTSRLAHSATLRAEDFLCCDAPAPLLCSLCLSLISYISLWNEQL